MENSPTPDHYLKFVAALKIRREFQKTRLRMIVDQQQKAMVRLEITRNHLDKICAYIHQLQECINDLPDCGIRREMETRLAGQLYKEFILRRDSEYLDKKIRLELAFAYQMGKNRLSVMDSFLKSCRKRTG